MDGTIIGQGFFTASSLGLSNPTPGVASRAAANAAVIQIPSGVDWLSVRNYTAAGAAGTAVAFFNGVGDASIGVEFYWQRGMPVAEGMVSYYDTGAQAVSGDTFVSGGFTLYDPSGQDLNALPALSAARATTASTNATRPVVSTANTDGLAVGSIVRLSNTAQTDINGIDFVVGAVTPGVSFTLLTASNPLANAPGAIGGAGFYRVVNTNPLFYPRVRYIVDISNAAEGVVSTSAPHGLTPGQEVRFNIPAVAGMVQLNGNTQNNYRPATIVEVIDDYNFAIDIDTTAFTAFSYPTIAQQPSSFPIVTPFGEDTATSLASPFNQVPMIGGLPIFNANTGLLADSTVNTGFLGMVLGSGGDGLALGSPLVGPSGSISWSAADVATGDLMFWRAGKSTYGGL